MMKIYLISSAQDGGRVYKIGYTRREVHERVRELKTGNSSDMVVESFFVSRWARKIEKALHRHFRTSRISGEWFGLAQHQVADFLRICQITHDGLEMVEMHNTYIRERGGVGRMRA